jgi:cytidyltransferase-like protein
MESLRASMRPALLVQHMGRAPARVAVLPGSFDPITIAHAALAEAAAAWADLTILLYSVRTIAKEETVEPPLLSEPDRIRSLQAFSRGKAGLEVGLCSHGLLVDQVRAARDRFASARLRLAVGSDKLLQLLDPTWYEDPEAALAALFEQAEVMYALREGEEPAVKRALADVRNAKWSGRVQQLDVPPNVASVSSRLVRSLARQGRDVGRFVPAEALPYLPRSTGGVGPGPGWE